MTEELEIEDEMTRWSREITMDQQVEIFLALRHAHSFIRLLDRSAIRLDWDFPHDAFYKAQKAVEDILFPEEDCS